MPWRADNNSVFINLVNMTIKNASFVKGVVKAEDLPRDTLPYIAFLGRSNVGKSSTLNMLADHSGLARKSSRPGKTTEINLFLVNKNVYFADLPGYGFAKQPDDLRAKIEEMISWYVADPYIQHKLLVLIIDMRVGVTDLDLGMLATLRLHHPPEKLLVLANKADGLKQSELTQAMRDIQVRAAGIKVVPISARTGAGRKEAISAILA